MEKRARHTEKMTVNAIVANTGCQHNKRKADWLTGKVWFVLNNCANSIERKPVNTLLHKGLANHFNLILPKFTCCIKSDFFFTNAHGPDAEFYFIFPKTFCFFLISTSQSHFKRSNHKLTTHTCCSIINC